MFGRSSRRTPMEIHRDNGRLLAILLILELAKLAYWLFGIL